MPFEIKSGPIMLPELFPMLNNLREKFNVPGTTAILHTVTGALPLSPKLNPSSLQALSVTVGEGQPALTSGIEIETYQPRMNPYLAISVSQAPTLITWDEPILMDKRRLPGPEL
jgi:hypothetical protein